MIVTPVELMTHPGELDNYYDNRKHEDCNTLFDDAGIGRSSQQHKPAEHCISIVRFLAISRCGCSSGNDCRRGAGKERKAWEAAPPTLRIYATDDVCVDKGTGKVMNCGHCGSCSNPHDIKIYHDTRSTLTKIMTDCARGDILFGIDAHQCLKENVAMTDGCTKCWVLNYKCNVENCVRTCLKHRFFPFLPSWKPWNSEPLDPCIACDEKLCGPAFVGCAGANRRRVGVITDIERDHEREICDKVDWDWVLRRGNNHGNQDNGSKRVVAVEDHRSDEL